MRIEILEKVRVLNIYIFKLKVELGKNNLFFGNKKLIRKCVFFRFWLKE